MNRKDQELNNELIFLARMQRIIEKDKEYKLYRESFVDMGFVNRIVNKCFEELSKGESSSLLGTKKK
jgi:hypothetical protein